MSAEDDLRTVYNYVLESHTPERTIKTVSIYSMLDNDETEKWHHRLAHLNIRSIIEMANGGFVKGLPVGSIHQAHHKCTHCLAGKATREPYPSVPDDEPGPPLEIGDELHSDQMGPIRPLPTTQLARSGEGSF